MTAQAAQINQQPKGVNPIDRLWRLIASDRVLALLVALLAFSILIGLLLPQLPVEARQDGTAERWLAETSSQYGPLGGLLRAGGFFDLRQSIWLRGLMGLLAFVLLLRLAQANAEAADRLRGQKPSTLAPFARRWPLQGSLQLAGQAATPAGPPDQAAGELAEDLRSEGWRVVSDSQAGQVHLAAERSVPGLLAMPVFYAGLVLILVALWLGQLLGWQEAGLTLLPGETTRLSEEPGTTLTLLPVTNGRLAVALQAGDGTQASSAFSSGGNARVGGLNVRRTGEGLALSISARDGQDASLPLQTLEQQAPLQPSLNLVFEQPRAERVFLAPTRQLAFSVVAFSALPERGFSGPTFLVQAFEVGQRQPVFNDFVAGDSEIAIGADRYTLDSGQYVTVQASRNPGLPLLLLGGLIAILGLLLGILRPAGRLYLHLQEGSGAVDVFAGLQPSLAWREAARWFAAWSATYESNLEASS